MSAYADASRCTSWRGVPSSQARSATTSSAPRPAAHSRSSAAPSTTALLSASTGQIYVVRNAPDNLDTQQIFNLNARNPAALALADRFELQPRDVVYVDHVPLVTWNRVISLILPSAQVVNLGRDTARR